MVWKEKVNYLVRRIMNADAYKIAGETPLLQGGIQCDGEATGDEDNQVLYINWHDAEGKEFGFALDEGGLSDARVDHDMIVLEDAEGEETTIILYDLVQKDDIQTRMLEALNLMP